MKLSRLYQKLIFLLILIACNIPSQQALAESYVNSNNNLKRFVVGVARDDDDPVTQYLNAVYLQLFESLNTEVVFRYVPAKRLPYEVTSGEIDSDPWRVSQYGKQNPDLVQVREPILDSVFALFACTDVKLQTWRDVSESGYGIAYRRGVVKIEERLEGVEDSLKHGVNRAQHAATMLHLGRVDLYIDLIHIGRESFLGLPPNSSCKKPQLVAKLEERQGFSFLNAKHKTLAQQLELGLKRLRENGELQQLKLQYFGVTN